MTTDGQDLRLDRAFGVLLGQCAGDSLGAQVEFRPAESIHAEFPNGVRAMVGGGPHGILAGQVTDDSELALALARSIANEGEWVEEAVAAAYVDWKLSPPFDCGGTCSRALGFVNLNKAIAPQIKNNALGALSSEANGSLMRASPLGILFAGQEPDQDGVEVLLERQARVARADSALTHANKRCQQAVAVFTLAIANLLNSDGTLDERRQKAYEHAIYVNSMEDTEATAWIAELLLAAKNGPAQNADYQQGWVKHGFHNVFHQLLTAPTFEEGIVRTIALGGDTDTNGAIAGGLLGALFGAQGVPVDWKNKVLKCRSRRPSTYHADDIEDLAKKILFPAF